MTLARWTTPDIPYTIEYTLGVMEEIRALAVDGFHRLSRGGVEVGGVLFGTHTDETVQVRAMRAVNCSYARGPAYLLSEVDHVEFARVLESHTIDPELQGLVPVGWFVSHTRTGLLLTEFDRELFSTYFLHLWQIALVVRPQRSGFARAAFFVRDTDGQLPMDGNPPEFGIEPFRPNEAKSGNRTERVPTTVSPPAAPPQVTAPAFSIPRVEPAAREPNDAGLPSFLRDPEPVKTYWWRWVVVAIFLVALAGIGARAYLASTPTAAEPFWVQAKEQDGNMFIEWSRTTPPVAKAQRGVLEITDDNHTRVVHLSANELARGLYPFIRKGTDVNVRLTLFDPSGSSIEKVTRYLGQPVVNSLGPDLVSAQAERDRLEQENQQLNSNLTAEKARVQQLEKRVATLENLIRIERKRLDVLHR
jgi:proteasome lid subunit RPN8/RPN11